MAEKENLNPEEILENILFLTNPSKFNAELFNGMRIILEKLTSIEEKIDKFNFFNVENDKNNETQIEFQENDKNPENQENDKNKPQNNSNNLMGRLEDVQS